jgi:DNA-binding Xre family transcriptional regulator
VQKSRYLDFSRNQYIKHGKLSKGENVHAVILVRICKATECDADDVMEIYKEDM